MGRCPGASLLCAALLAAAPGCSRPAPPRLPSVAEVSPEVVVANYAPPRLRLFTDRGSQGAERYLIVGTEMPQLVAKWRPLAVVDRTPPPGHRVRGGELAWVAGHVALAQAEGGAGALLLYDRDSRKADRVVLKTPAPCTVTAAPLLIGEADSLHGLLRCEKEGRSYVFSADGAGAVQRMDEAPLLGEIYRRGDDGDYVLGGGALLRLGARPARAALPAAASPEARELLLGEGEVVIVDAAAGRLQRLRRDDLRAAGEARFPARPARRLRAALAGDHVIAVLSERRGPGSELFGLSLPLGGGKAPAPLFLGTGPAESDHEVVPTAGAKEVRALLVRTHEGNTGPLVALSKLAF